MFHYLLVLVAFATVFVQGDNLCGPNDRCPPHHKCVPGTGCVRTNIACQQPETPCSFPLISDCKGGCMYKNCSSRKSCLRLVNPSDKCDKATCMDGRCVAERLTCAGCNPTTGCPTRRASTTIGATHMEEDDDTHQQQQQQVRKNVKKTGWDHDDDDDDDDHHHHHDTTTSGWGAGTISGVVFLLIGTLTVFGALAYLGTTARRVGY